MILTSGGLPQPGPIFQALPEPAPLPPLPMPEMPAEAMTPGMAPETAPAGLPQPGTSYQVACSLSTYYQKRWEVPSPLNAQPIQEQA